MDDTPKVVVPNNQVWYYAPEKVTLYTSTNVQSHTFENGKGVLTFSGNVTTVSAWFRAITTITAVRLPDTVTTIANYAFYGCTNMKCGFSMPNLTSLGNYAFRGSGVASFYAPKVTSISGSTANPAEGVFALCTNLRSINFQACTTINYNAFRGCTSLTTINIPAVKTIQSSAFYGCSNLTGDISLPALTTLGQYVFRGTSITSFYAPLVTSLPGSSANPAEGVFTLCTKLVSVSLQSCTSIGYNTFLSCSSLTTVYMPAVKTIQQRAFYGCTKLTGDISLSELTTLGNYAFRGTGITSFSAPKLTSVPGNQYNPGEGAFTLCSKLQSLDIPACTTIGHNAVASCTSLRNVNMPSIQTIQTYAFNGDTQLVGDLSLPKLTTCNYAAFNNTAITSFKAKSLATLSGTQPNPAIGFLANCKQMTRAEFPSVSAVQYNAFRNDAKLAEIDFSGSLRSTIPTIQYNSSYNPFYGCAAGYQILVPKSLEADWKAASGWSNIASHIVGEVIPSNEIWYYADSQVTLYDSTDVSTHTFNDGKGVITLNGDITSVKQWLRGTDVERVKLPVEVVTIEDYAFAGCTTLLGVVNTLQVTTIGAHAFDGCTKLQNVNVTTTLTNAVTVGDYAFANSSVTSATIPVTVTSLGDGVFNGCTSMTTFTMTAGGLASIPEDMFNGCVKLATVTISDVTQIGASAFEGCVLLASIAMPATLAIGASAFKDCAILASLDFSTKADTTIPTLGADALSGIDASFVVNVPAALETDWQADADWVDYASHIVGV